MAGHSKWKQIKHAKAVTDQRRGKLFTKLAREIIVAAQQGGGDPDANFRLRMAIQHAKDANMPNDNIDRAVKRGTGEGADGVQMIEAVYEGYGPGGVAIMLETLTDNRNRTVSAVRTMLTRAGGNLAESGSVSWQFEKRGVITVETVRRRGRRPRPHRHRRRSRGRRHRRLDTPGLLRARHARRSAKRPRVQRRLHQFVRRSPSSPATPCPSTPAWPDRS